MALGALNGLVNAADIPISSTVLGSASDFAIVLAANKYAAVDFCGYFSLAAGHGGLRLNWLVPNRIDTGAWPLAKIRDDWTVVDINSENPVQRIVCAGINDPMHDDAAIIARPGAATRAICVRGSCLFKAPAGGGTVNLTAALVAAGGTVTVLANSQVEYRVY